ARGALQYTSELEQSGLHGDLHSFPTRRSSDLLANNAIGKESDLDQEFMVGHGAIMKERLQHTETLPGTQFHTVSELENFLLLIGLNKPVRIEHGDATAFLICYLNGIFERLDRGFRKINWAKYFPFHNTNSFKTNRSGRPISR